MSAQPQPPKKRLLFRLFKGFIYGNVIGLIFGTAIYLLASAVNAIAALPYDPRLFMLLIYAASVMAGTAKEYSEWLEEGQ